MFLRSIRVESWRAIRDAVELAELSPGINIVHGPNETGKSTILDAICRGFFDRHRTASMRNRQPWGTSLGPAVDIEFQISEQRWQLRKQFLDAESCELRRLHNGS